MKLSETTPEYCVIHGHQDFFLGIELDDGGEYCGEALFCPMCDCEHPDNPVVVAKFEVEQEEMLKGVMAL